METKIKVLRDQDELKQRKSDGTKVEWPVVKYGTERWEDCVRCDLFDSLVQSGLIESFKSAETRERGRAGSACR